MLAGRTSSMFARSCKRGIIFVPFFQCLSRNIIRRNRFLQRKRFCLFMHIGRGLSVCRLSVVCNNRALCLDCLTNLNAIWQVHMRERVKGKRFCGSNHQPKRETTYLKFTRWQHRPAILPITKSLWCSY